MFVSHQSFFLLFKKEIWHSARTRPRKRYAKCLCSRVSAAGPRCGQLWARRVYAAGRGFENSAHPSPQPDDSGHRRPKRLRSPQRSAAGSRCRGIPRSPGPSPPGHAAPPEAPRAGAAPRSAARCGRTPLCLRRGGDAHPGPRLSAPIRAHRVPTRTACADTRAHPACAHIDASVRAWVRVCGHVRAETDACVHSAPARAVPRACARPCSPAHAGADTPAHARTRARTRGADLPRAPAESAERGRSRPTCSGGDGAQQQQQQRQPHPAPHGRDRKSVV